MMKIAVIAHGLSSGGAERVAAILANRLAARGHEVLFLAAYSPEREYALDRRIRYEAVLPGRSAGLLRLYERSVLLLRLVREFRADAVFSFITDALVPLVLSGIPVIPSLRTDPGRVQSRKLRGLIQTFVFHRAHAVVFQTEQARDFYGPAIRRKGAVIGNPLTPDLPDWDAANHRRVILAACRLVPQKNLPMLMDAFVRFHKLHPDYTLEIYGEAESPAYLAELTRYRDSSGAADSVAFMGRSAAIHEVMKNSAAFVLSSDYEGLSNAMLEALAIGVPTVSTDSPPGGARAYIIDGVNGALVPVGDADALCRALCRVAQSPDLMRAWSLNARTVRGILGADAICDQWIALIPRRG
ncbi:MAG: glycosyltransferase family 4 protein [Clostridiales bacterium]|nr:glycosyltransferase family 4 protein [Clostridiales bacterium]